MPWKRLCIFCSTQTPDIHAFCGTFRRLFLAKIQKSLESLTVRSQRGGYLIYCDHTAWPDERRPSLSEWMCKKNSKNTRLYADALFFSDRTAARFHPRLHQLVEPDIHSGMNLFENWICGLTTLESLGSHTTPETWSFSVVSQYSNSNISMYSVRPDFYPWSHSARTVIFLSVMWDPFTNLGLTMLELPYIRSQC